jgi:hypothetical protein
MFYTSYKEAHETLDIPGSWQRGTQGNKTDGITSLKLTANPNSLDRISSDFSRIYYVGIGKKSSQGEPSVDQRKEDQEPFFTSLAKQNPIPVLIKLKAGLVYFPGLYKVKTIQPKTSPKGIQYYQIGLLQS